MENIKKTIWNMELHPLLLTKNLTLSVYYALIYYLVIVWRNCSYQNIFLKLETKHLEHENKPLQLFSVAFQVMCYWIHNLYVISLNPMTTICQYLLKYLT